MLEACLIRSLRFPAVHQYRRPEWSDSENRRVFGEQAEPHGHEFVVQVTVKGPVDPGTGFLVDLAALDRVLEAAVAPLRGSNLAESIPEAREGSMLPSTENLARWLYARLEDAVPGGSARLVRVRVAESDSLAAEFPAE